LENVLGNILSGMDGLRREKKEAAHACAPHRPNQNDERLLLFRSQGCACGKARAIRSVDG